MAPKIGTAFAQVSYCIWWFTIPYLYICILLRSPPSKASIFFIFIFILQIKKNYGSKKWNTLYSIAGAWHDLDIDQNILIFMLVLLCCDFVVILINVKSVMKPWWRCCQLIHFYHLSPEALPTPVPIILMSCHSSLRDTDHERPREMTYFSNTTKLGHGHSFLPFSISYWLYIITICALANPETHHLWLLFSSLPYLIVTKLYTFFFRNTPHPSPPSIPTTISHGQLDLNSASIRPFKTHQKLFSQN